MLIPLDLKTSLVRNIVSPGICVYLCFPSSSFCLFASGSCLLHQNKVTSALLMVDSVFQEQKHQEKTRPWVVLAYELSLKTLKKPTKIIFASTNSTNPSARIYIHTFREDAFGKVTFMNADRVVKSFLVLLLHQITMASFSLQTFCCTSFTQAPPQEHFWHL